MVAPRASSQTTGIDPPVIADPVIQVYVPPKVGNPHCVIFNNGASPAYLGGTGVSLGSGLYFPPNAQLTLPYMPFGVWAVSGYSLGTATTTLTANAPAGGTVISCGSLASMTVGSSVQIGNANAPTSFDVVTIASFQSAGTITTTSPTLFDHISGGTVTVVASQTGTSLSVNTGVT